MLLSVLKDPAGRGWLKFDAPLEVTQVYDVDGVDRALSDLENRVNREQLVAVGFLSYEAAPAFDSALVTRTPNGELPLLCFALYRPETVTVHADLGQALEFATAGTEADAAAGRGSAVGAEAAGRTSQWRLSVTAEEYAAALSQIKHYIGRGDSYQVNYSYRLRSELTEPPARFFPRLYNAQPAEFATYIESDRWAICSVSPELFFSVDDQAIEMRPMKGTISRGRTLEEDRLLAATLSQSEKDRAENLMIVDMMRNDVGRIARPGSVKVPELFHLEKYHTLWQMTSRVIATSERSPGDILRALFPCASITGAPKARTMEIIAELESSPRGLYTGAIGIIQPGGNARFSVAIRTATAVKRRGSVEYGVGGGIVWDSDTDRELSESKLKAAVLSQPVESFELLETILWRARSGFWLLEEHLARLEASAEYFSFALDRDEVVKALRAAVGNADAERLRVRLRVDRSGTSAVECAPFAAAPEGSVWRVRLAAEAIDSTDRFLYHKTTNRTLYERARVAVPECDDVLLWNEAGYVTESTIANLVVRVGDEFLTPPLSCGLLAGSYRARLLREGTIREEHVHTSQLHAVDELYVVNSLRGWVPVKLLPPASAERARRNA